MLCIVVSWRSLWLHLFNFPSIQHATLTKHKMAKYLLQLLYLNRNSRAPTNLWKMNRTCVSRLKTSNSFSISPAVFQAAEEQGHGGGAAANKKWDAGGYGGGQQPAGAGSAGESILLTLFLLFSVKILKLCSLLFYFRKFVLIHICFTAPVFCAHPHNRLWKMHCWKFKMLHFAARTQQTARTHAPTGRTKKPFGALFDDAAESVIDKWGVNNILLTHIQECSQTLSLFYSLSLNCTHRGINLCI